MKLSYSAVHRILMRVALSGVHLFSWVFVFQYFYIQNRSISAALVNVLLTYAVAQVTVMFLTPLAARRLRHGLKRSLFFATLALAASFATLASAFSGALGDIGFGIALFALLTGVYRAFYWIPYTVSQEVNDHKYREWVEIFVALMPLLVGLYLTDSNMSLVYVLYGASVVALLSMFPVLRYNDAHEGYPWGYRQSFHELFDARHRFTLYASILSGVEAATLFMLWPITVFTILEWSYPLLGVVMSLTLLFTLIARKLFGPAMHTVPMRVQPLLAASGWVMRLGVGGFVSAILVDTYFHTASRSHARGIDMNALEHIADNHTFVDEFTALKEMGMALGRIVLCLTASVLLLVFELPYALALSFVVAAFAAGLSVYYFSKSSNRIGV